MGTISGKATLSFSFLPPVSLGVKSLRKEFAPTGEILFFKSRLYIKRVTLSREANRKSEKLLPFVKVIENHVGVLLQLKTNNVL